MSVTSIMGFHLKDGEHVTVDAFHQSDGGYVLSIGSSSLIGYVNIFADDPTQIQAILIEALQKLDAHLAYETTETTGYTLPDGFAARNGGRG